ncbi:hypothetical protein ACFSR7_24990 [Cohnella sp. GCM10020058]|uniref:hypothetical protein n=1 Tax=Cohnella sp. GCM10020058 TaxID=3317330 RepID=UPI003636878F
MGTVPKNDWTSIFDIAKPNASYSLEDYILFEELYIEAITGFIDFLQLRRVQVQRLEKRDKKLRIHHFPQLYSREMVELYSSVQEYQLVDKESAGSLSRLALRENLWFKLIAGDKLFVHFGYDYYMYIGSDLACSAVINKIINSGLFAEPWISPYHPEE